MSDTNDIEILLVEDNPDDLEMAIYALQRTNVARRIEVARDGQEALDFLFCLGRHATRRIEDLPKLVLLDLKLPKVDGLEVLRALKADPRTQHLPVVMLTSSQEPSDVAQSYRLGANSYVVKPVDFEQYSSAVQQVGQYWLRLNQRQAL